jgi:hypothetical protein
LRGRHRGSGPGVHRLASPAAVRPVPRSLEVGGQDDTWSQPSLLLDRSDGPIYGATPRRSARRRVRNRRWTKPRREATLLMTA